MKSEPKLYCNKMVRFATFDYHFPPFVSKEVKVMHYIT